MFVTSTCAALVAILSANDFIVAGKSTQTIIYYLAGFSLQVVAIYLWLTAVVRRGRDCGIGGGATLSLYCILLMWASMLTAILPFHLFLAAALAAWPGDVGSNLFGASYWPAPPSAADSRDIPSAVADETADEDLGGDPSVEILDCGAVTGA
jgi:hypothetical protein